MRALVTVACILALIPFPAGAFNWSGVASVVEQSVVVITETGLGPICSGFVVNQKKHLVLSANHCWHSGNILFDGATYTVVWYDEKLDLMLLAVGGIDKPALKLRTKPVLDGMEVLTLGYAYGASGIFSRAGNVSAASVLPPLVFAIFMSHNGRDPTVNQMALDFDTVNGMSGGPIIDTNGRVISVVQMGDGVTGLHIQQEDLVKAVGMYFQ